MKRFISLWSVLFGSGIVVAGFILDPTGIVDSSLLHVFAICIVNAAALEGIDLSAILRLFENKKHASAHGE